MPLCFTSTMGYPSRHFCSDCADNQEEVQDELDQASDRDALEIHDDVLDEICTSCGRSIAGVPVVPGMYTIEVEVVFDVRVAPARRADVQSLLSGEQKIGLEDAEEAIQEAIQEVEDPELDKVVVRCGEGDFSKGKIYVWFKTMVTFSHVSALAAEFDFFSAMEEVTYGDARDAIKNALREALPDLGVTVYYSDEYYGSAKLEPPKTAFGELVQVG